MAQHSHAGKPARLEDLTNIPRLMAAYYLNKPDMSKAEQRVAFGTSGHRGSSLNSAFTESHILAVSQAIAEYRSAQGITGPLFIGMDTHALSESALASAVEVLAANGVEVRIDKGLGYTPTRSSPMPSCATTRRAWLIRPTVSSSHRRTIRRKMVVSNTIRPMVARPKARSPSGLKTAPTSCSRRGWLALSASLSPWLGPWPTYKSTIL